MPLTRFLRYAPLLLLTGCATMIHGTTQDIPIFTPDATSVAVDGQVVGASPMRATVSRDRSHLVTITKDSAPRIEVELERSVSAWVLGNLFIDYLPAIVDFMDGAAYKFDTKSIDIRFPGREASAAMLRADLAVYQRIRFSTGGELMNARVDSATTERLYVHTGTSARAMSFTEPTSVRLSDIQRLDVGAPNGQWAPHAARRLGSSLLTDDEVRLTVDGHASGLEGRLVTMDTANLYVATSSAVTRIDRSTITLVQRRQDHDYAEGARRSLLVGAILGGLIAAKAKGNLLNPDGLAFMKGNAIGALVGLSLTPILAPGKWVTIRKW